MQFLISDEDKFWDLAKVQLLWKAWKSRPPEYMDANGTSMLMQIDSAFKKSGATEPIGISHDEISFGSEKVLDLEFFDSGFNSSRHRIRVDVNRAKQLVDILTEFLHDPHQGPRKERRNIYNELDNIWTNAHEMDLKGFEKFIQDNY